MKSLTKIIGMAGLAALFCAGCQQSDNSAVDTAEPGEVIEEVSIEETVTESAETAKQVISDANAKAQDLLTQAQTLVGEKKYEEAGNLLQKLADYKLTPEQQKMFDDLKTTIQKAMESGAVQEGAKAIGGMMGGDK